MGFATAASGSFPYRGSRYGGFATKAICRRKGVKWRHEGPHNGPRPGQARRLVSPPRGPFTKKIMLGTPAEVLGEGPSKKSRGRKANIGHFPDEIGSDHFLRIIFKPNFGQLLIPDKFVKWFGSIPSNIIVRTNSGCSWRMTTRREGKDTFIDQGCTTFAIAHHLKICQFLTFKKVSTLEYSLVIFDHTCTDVMSRCPDHGDATGCVIFEEEV
ncbi:hypothetical protein QYE76_061606 [Lolium multiflorum]|uniref:TF-B3 domain-containing protein n=1 Tax=Lolium multiflorum TaxID=4521 RepID=A0AAD8W4V5_LOLMU|nr:hypothetical protein QYE76_061606 [Lolium multiflorum]